MLVYCKSSTGILDKNTKTIWKEKIMFAEDSFLMQAIAAVIGGALLSGVGL